MHSDNNSITFRSYTLQSHNNRRSEDDDKPIAKIESSQMEKLGVKEGELLKITGRCSAVAFCHLLDDEEIERTKSQDIQIEYLNSSHKEKEMELNPRIVLSSKTYQNACPTRHAMLVQVEKFTAASNNMIEEGNLSQNISSSNNILPEASVVTFGTMEFLERAMPNYKENIDFSALFGNPIKRKERINLPFLPEYMPQYDQNIPRNKNPNRPMTSIPPKTFSSMIVNTKPDSEFLLVTENTKFQFQNISMDEFSGGSTKPEAMSLLRVIPIVKRLHLDDTDIMFSSLEIFENSIKLRYYSQYHKKLPDEFLSDPEKFQDMIKLIPDNPQLVVEIKDDLGNKYSDGFDGGGGGGSGPDPSTNEYVSNHQHEYRFTSATLDPNAKELFIIVKEVRWVQRDRRIPKPSKPPHMTPLTEPNYKISILEGPWEFKIPLEQI